MDGKARSEGAPIFLRTIVDRHRKDFIFNLSLGLFFSDLSPLFNATFKRHLSLGFSFSDRVAPRLRNHSDLD